MSVCLICVLRWPERTMGVEFCVTCQMQDMIQTHACHVKYRFRLINFVFYNILRTSILFWFLATSNLGLSSYFHTFWSYKIKIDAKNISGCSVFSEHVCFVICYWHHFFMTTPAWKAEHPKKKKNRMKIWHDSLKHSHSQDSLQQNHARAGTRCCCSNQWKHVVKSRVLYLFYIPGRLSTTVIRVHQNWATWCWL